MEPFQARPIEALLTGRARALGTPEVLSGIDKKARQGALWLALDGLKATSRATGHVPTGRWGARSRPCSRTTCGRPACVTSGSGRPGWRRCTAFERRLASGRSRTGICG